jgi:multidrug transporter EmrE-like cation transporter
MSAEMSMGYMIYGGTGAVLLVIALIVLYRLRHS